MTTKPVPKAEAIRVGADEQPVTMYQNGHGNQNGDHRLHEFGPVIVPPTADRADLPTFPLDVGWREFDDPETGQRCRAPLTLLDIHYPTEDDIGVVFMAQSIIHNIWCMILANLLRTYLDASKFLVTQDNLIYWERGTIPPNAPDLAVIPGGKTSPDEHNSFRVGRDGPIPAFVVEITSKGTCSEDLTIKPTKYAAIGIKEYLIIDFRTHKNKDWALIGYRLEASSPYYKKMKPDADGGLTFETIGLRFVAVKRERIDVYNTATGERLLTLDEQKARAEAAEAARLEKEQINQALEKENARLKAQLAQKSANGKSPK